MRLRKKVEYCLHISKNASLDWDGSDYVAHAAQIDEFLSPQRRAKNLRKLGRSFLHPANRGNACKKGVAFYLGAPLSAAATVVFSTESAPVRTFEQGGS